MDILCKLLLVHLIADFVLQWPKMLKGKEQQHFFSPLLYVHGLIHFVFSLLMVWDFAWLLPLLIVSVTHTIIDGLKGKFTTPKNERFLFFLDQILHLVIIVAVWAYVTGTPVDITVSVPHFWVHAVFLFFITFPASIFIQKVFLKWTLPQVAGESLRGVGAYIGYFERILIYIAVVSTNWSLIGFLIAAKSIFRFGDFNKSEDRHYIEYLFVGTMLSLFIAVISGVGFFLMTGQSITQ